MGVPAIYFTVKNERTSDRWYKYYYESYHNPMLIAPGSFQPGDKFKITVSNDWYGMPSRDFTLMLYAKIDKDTVWITNDGNYANMMHMDGSKPTGFIDSEYSNGIEHSMPNHPLRCFYYQHERQSFKSCTEYGYEYIYYPDEDDQDDGDGDNHDDGDHQDNNTYDYKCGNLEYDPQNYTYTCKYDMWGNEESCECELIVTCLRDIFVYSHSHEEFWELFFRNYWTIFVWFTVDDAVNYFSKALEIN